MTKIDALKTLLSGPNPLLEQRAKLVETVKSKDKFVAELRRLQSLVRAQRKHRRQQALLLNSISKPPRPARGRPPLEDSEEFKELPDLIVRVAMQLAAADPRRRAEIYSIPKTLDDLQEELRKQGMTINKQTLYLRLVPRRKNSVHGKRHVRVVPVKLRKPQFDGRKKHVSARFCFAVSLMLRELAS